MSTELHVFQHGSSFVQSTTNYVRYYMGRKFIVRRELDSHTTGGTYLYRQAMIRQQPGWYTTIPGSGLSRQLTSANTHASHLRHVQKVFVYYGSGIDRHEFDLAPF